MGFYGSVNYTTPCPKCGNEVTGFKTKDLDGLSKAYEITQLWDGCIIYSYCDNCKEEITLRVKRVTPPVVRVDLVVYDDEDETEEEKQEWAEFIRTFHDKLGD